MPFVDCGAFRISSGRQVPNKRETKVTRPDNFHSSSRKKYKDVLDRMKTVLSKQASISLMTDAWNSMHKGVFHDGDRPLFDIGVNVYCVEHRCVRRAPHSCKHRQLHSRGCRQIGLRSKVVVCVHDNTANVMLAGAMLEEEDGWKNIRYAAHLLQLAVNMGLEDVASIQKELASARHLVGHFKKSTVSSSFLHQRQRTSGHPALQLISDCATRWNSTYEMARRLLNERVYVELALIDARREDLKR